jgi:hypothetical protein
LKRNELSAQTNWKSNWNNFNSFKTTPNNLDIQTAFDEAYDANAWYTHLAPTDTYADTWGFTIDSALGIFYIYGNPYWNSQNNQTASGAPTTYQFNYVLDTKILLSSQMINSSSTAITTLNFESDTNWATHPDQFNVDVYDALHNLVNASVWPNVAWLQIQLSFDSNAKTITLSPLATSTIYTSDTWTVNYTTIF